MLDKQFPHWRPARLFTGKLVLLMVIPGVLEDGYSG